MMLLPAPRHLRLQPGHFTLPKQRPLSAVNVLQTDRAPAHPEGYTLTVDSKGVTLAFRTPAGLRAATATLRQLLREHGRRLPYLKIRDWPDFTRRGVMLDISRGRVPQLATLLDLVERLADFKLNELQLYTEHTVADRNYRSVWQSWGALTGEDIRRLDARCRELGIDLVPNQNSFGHLRYFLADPRLKKLAEIPVPYEAETKDFLRRPTTLAPEHPGTLPSCAASTVNCSRISQAVFSTSAATKPGTLAKARARPPAPGAEKAACISTSFNSCTAKSPPARKP